MLTRRTTKKSWRARKPPNMPVNQPNKKEAHPQGWAPQSRPHKGRLSIKTKIEPTPFCQGGSAQNDLENPPDGPRVSTRMASYNNPEARLPPVTVGKMGKMD